MTDFLSEQNNTNNNGPKVVVTKLDTTTDELMNENNMEFLNMSGGARPRKQKPEPEAEIAENNMRANNLDENERELNIEPEETINIQNTVDEPGITSSNGNTLTQNTNQNTGLQSQENSNNDFELSNIPDNNENSQENEINLENAENINKPKIQTKTKKQSQKSSKPKTKKKNIIKTTPSNLNNLPLDTDVTKPRKAGLMINSDGNIKVTMEKPEFEFIRLNSNDDDRHIRLETIKGLLTKEVRSLKSMNAQKRQNLAHDLKNKVAEDVYVSDSMLEGLVKVVDDFDLKKLALEKLIKEKQIKLSF